MKLYVRNTVADPVLAGRESEDDRAYYDRFAAQQLLRRRSILLRLCWSAIVLLVIYLLLTILSQPQFSLNGVIIVLAIAIQFITIVLVKRGHVNGAIIMALYFCWNAVTMASVFGGGIQSTAFLASWPRRSPSPV
jgi:hypothetical protein